jgi:2-polyprenyl-6-methoxyphenol hydroxylase-like FAD-dependent oxidoreductase
MAAALHLSPLVAAGLVNGPIDVYEANSERQRSRCGKNGGKQVYPGSGAVGRDIGVGIWSSAWWPFLRSLEAGLSSASKSENHAIDSLSSLANKVQCEKNRFSFRTLLQDLEACGSYVGNVGYRTPDGSWLVKSELNASPFGVLDLLSSSMTDGNTPNDDNNNDAMSTKTINDNEHHPALLFVREKDLLSCLRNAINMESRLGTVKYHTGIRVEGIENMDGDLGSLLLCSTVDEKTGTQGSATSLSPQYNLIIAADGLYSSLRSRFAGHRSIHATGGIGSSSTSNSTVGYNWEHTQGQREATEVEDREYIVFRGNAPKLTTNYCGVVDDACDVSFQTWGEKESMRFAAVPFRHRLEDPSLKDDCNDNNCGNVGRYSNSESFINSKTKEEEVWFATISDPIFINAFKSSSSTDDSIDSNRMKQLLLEAFGSWHQPVKTLIETTPSDAIMYELAVAHRHSAGPVCDVGRILEFERWQASMNRKMKEAGGNEVIPFPPDEGGRINGRGPIIVFIGDAMMTVDPVLAQGFTIAMESGASIVQSIEHILLRQHSQATTSSSVTPPIMYHPKLLRDELLQRHNHRERRLLQLLRSTELVQRMAQPHGFGSTLLATWIVRPIIKLCPDSLKMKVFDYMIRYSLGLTGDQK